MTRKGRFFATVALATGLAMVPAIGSRGAGALGESRSHTDSHLLTPVQSPLVLDAASGVAEARVAEIVRF